MHWKGKAIQFLLRKDQNNDSIRGRKKKKNDNKHVKRKLQHTKVFVCVGACVYSICMFKSKWSAFSREFLNVRTLFSLNGMSSIEQ